MMNMNTYYYLYYPNELHPTHKARKWNADHTSCVLATVLAYCTSFNGKNNYQYFQLCFTSISCLLVSCSCLQLQCPCPPTSQLVAAAGVLFECTSEIFLVSDFYFSSIHLLQLLSKPLNFTNISFFFSGVVLLLMMFSTCKSDKLARASSLAQ